MNKKGMVIIYAFMLGMVCFLLGMALSNPLRVTIEESMNSDELNCTNPSITQQDHANCTSLDIMTPLFTGLLFGLSGMLLGAVALR